MDEVVPLLFCAKEILVITLTYCFTVLKHSFAPRTQSWREVNRVCMLGYAVGLACSFNNLTFIMFPISKRCMRAERGEISRYVAEWFTL